MKPVGDCWVLIAKKTVQNREGFSDKLAVVRRVGLQPDMLGGDFETKAMRFIFVALGDNHQTCVKRSVIQMGFRSLTWAHQFVLGGDH